MVNLRVALSFLGIATMNTARPADLPYYEVHVADNFCYMDKEAEYIAGLFPSGEEALAKCRVIVERCLKECAESGRTAAQVFECYKSFGDDPYLVARNGAPNVEFSAWDYAKQKSVDFVD
jgi:hypothetical protein